MYHYFALSLKILKNALKTFLLTYWFIFLTSGFGLSQLVASMCPYKRKAEHFNYGVISTGKILIYTPKCYFQFT